MNSRERTFLTLKHEQADRIPIDFWASTGTKENIQKHLGMSYEAFLDHWDVDFRYLPGPRYIGPTLSDNVDIWGVRRTVARVDMDNGTEIYSEVADSPLMLAQSVDDVKNYPFWPSPDMFDFGDIEAQCDAILAKDRVVVFMGDRLNRIAQLKPAMYLRGVENILMDLALNPEIVCTIFDRIRAFYLEYLERILTAANGKIDIVLSGDDFGSQNGLLISADMWREFIRPGFKQYIETVKAFDTATMHHTCGSVPGLIPDMIECGLDVLQSVQPDATGMTFADLERLFGDKICFQGGVSIQNTMPFGTPESVTEAVGAIASIASDHHNYIFCTAHNIQADTPVANITALMEAYQLHGRF